MTDYIADYRTWLQEEKHASDNTLSSYLRDINQFKTWLLGAGSPDLRRVKKDTINEYMLYLSGAGKSPATITRCTASLKSFYAYMLGRGAVKTNPAKNVAALKVDDLYSDVYVCTRCPADADLSVRIAGSCICDYLNQEKTAQGMADPEQQTVKLKCVHCGEYQWNPCDAVFCKGK